MKLQQFLLLTTAVSCGAVLADVPNKVPLRTYAPLWTNSPFTSPPPLPPPPELSNPLDDFVLLGVSPIGNGYRVTLLDRNDPDNRITVDPGNKDFEILSVTRRAGDPLGTVVRVATGGVEGDVSFDDSLLTLNPPPAAAAAPPARGQRGAPPAVPGQPDAGDREARAPRQRVVPPTPGAVPGGQPAARPTTGGRPTTTNNPTTRGPSTRGQAPQNWQDRRSRGR